MGVSLLYQCQFEHTLSGGEGGVENRTDVGEYLSFSPARNNGISRFCLTLTPGPSPGKKLLLLIAELAVGEGGTLNRTIFKPRRGGRYCSPGWSRSDPAGKPGVAKEPTIHPRGGEVVKVNTQNRGE